MSNELGTAKGLCYNGKSGGLNLEVPYYKHLNFVTNYCYILPCSNRVSGYAVMHFLFPLFRHTNIQKVADQI